MKDVSKVLKARSMLPTLRKFAPTQMALWPEERRAIANELARAALFLARDSRKPREFYDNVRLFVLGEGTMTYKGEELRIDDEDVFVTLAHAAREMAEGKMKVTISSSEICKANNWRQGQPYYTKIFKSIQRMKGGVITVYSKRLAKAIKCRKALDNNASEDELARLYDELAQAEESALALDQDGSKTPGEIGGMMVTLIGGEPTFTGGTGEIVDDIPQGNLTWEITLDRNMVMLFAKPYLTLVETSNRQVLSGTGKRLQAYFLSHKKPYAVKLRSLEQVCGITYKDLAALKYNINAELEILRQLGDIHDFDISKKSADGDDWLVEVWREPRKDENK